MEQLLVDLAARHGQPTWPVALNSSAMVKAVPVHTGKNERAPISAHGTEACYVDWGCRCDPCVAAAATSRKLRREKKAS